MKYWLVQKGIPRSWTNCYNLQYMKGGRIPQLIINRQGWIAATAHLEKSRAMSLCTKPPPPSPHQEGAHEAPDIQGEFEWGIFFGEGKMLVVFYDIISIARESWYHESIPRWGQALWGVHVQHREGLCVDRRSSRAVTAKTVCRMR